jgi:sigma-E factor negative regulatory protein RseA
MSREALQQSLSAVMDNEADELELRRVLSASGDTELRATWARYQVARAAMHKQLLLPKLDIAAAVAAALRDEAEPVAEKVARGPWRNLGRVAVAASVAVAVLAGVRLYHQDELDSAQLAQQGSQPVITLPQAQEPAVYAGFNSSDAAPSVETVSAEGRTAWLEQSPVSEHPAPEATDKTPSTTHQATIENR